MKNKELLEAIAANISPVITNLAKKDFKGATFIAADCEIDKALSEQYISGKWQAPDWLQELCKNKDEIISILVVEDIAKISEKEQLKFLEILKNRAIGSFKLPANVSIVVLCSDFNKLAPQIAQVGCII